MGELSKIEWTDHTFNPWIGCQKVSPGCDNCYAEAMMDRRYGRVQWGPHGERQRTSVANWRKPRQWNRAAVTGERRDKVFCASLSDWLDNRVPQQWREDLAIEIDETPNLDWLLLSKRIENWQRLSPWHDDDVPLNVWLGVTAEDQPNYDRRWSILQGIQAPVRFISYEPALGPLNLPTAGPYPDWIICGGESGPHARFMRPDWARDLMHQCAEVGVAFFMKQMTGKKPVPDELMVRQFPTPA